MNILETINKKEEILQEFKKKKKRRRHKCTKENTKDLRDLAIAYIYEKQMISAFYQRDITKF